MDRSLQYRHASVTASQNTVTPLFVNSSFRYEYPNNQSGKSVNLALKWFENNHMKADPSKFQAILFKRRKTEDVFFNLNIGDELFKPVSHVKLLDVLMDDNLSFNKHVSKLCARPRNRHMRYAGL